MRLSRRIAVLALVLFSASFTLAGEPPERPKPTAEHEALGQWVGSWAGKGEMKPGPFGDGGPMAWTEECSWFGGGKFNVVCKSEGSGAMGPMKGLGIIGYDVNKKAYVHFGVDSGGWMNYALGERTGDTWTFTAKEQMGEQVFHSRFSMTMESPGRMTFSWEMSENGTDWNLMMDGTSEKQ